jgi:hypothetical protein
MTNRLSVLVPLCAAVASTAPAATLTVTTTADAGPGSLRGAIAAAAAGDIIAFSLPVPSTIELTSGEQQVSKNLSIAGPGPFALTVRRSAAPGTPAFRVLHVTNASTVNVSGLTVSNGTATSRAATSIGPRVATSRPSTST